MSRETNTQDPLEFVRGMWSNMGFSLPGMVAPTLDVDELDHRIKDMRAVEGWLKMNLNMLQMSIQGLDMQRAALAAVRALSDQARSRQNQPESKPEEAASPANPFAAAASMWPWNMLTQPPAAAEPVEPAPPPKASRGRAGAKKEATMWPWNMMTQQPPAEPAEPAAEAPPPPKSSRAKAAAKKG